MSAVAKITFGMLLCLLLQTPSISGEPEGPATSKTLSDKDRLQGIWVFVTLTDKQEDRMLVAGDRIYWCVGEKTRAGTFTVDASKAPKHIDINLQDGDHTVAFRGIYRLNKDGWLFLNLAENDNPQPKGFKEVKFKEGEGQLMFLRGQQEIEIGTYTGEVNGKLWTLVLDKTNRLTIRNEERVVVTGAFIAKKKELILLSDKADATTEKVNTNYGKYRWASDGKMLSFKVIEDDRTVRAKAVTATKWLKSEQ